MKAPALESKVYTLLYVFEFDLPTRELAVRV
jgi:hypothetical protein